MQNQIKKTRIIIRVKGGIGNQLFCYVFGAYLNKKYGANIFYDEFSGYIFDKFDRKPILKKFFHEYELLAANPLHILIGYFSRHLPSRLLDCLSIAIIRESNYCEENIFEIEERKYKLIYFEGYWQDIKYLSYCIVCVKKLYNPPKINGDFESYKNILLSEESIIIHIRQKDIDLPISSNFYNSDAVKNILKSAYSLYYITDLDGGFQVLDNMGAKRINLSEFQDKDILEFELLRLANKKILSNSTFSYWAGYLSDSSDKIYYINTGENVNCILPNWINL